MMIGELEFKSNFNNKLGCKCFTTIRLSGRFSEGDKIIVIGPGQIRFGATVQGKRELPTIEAINEWVARLDTGYSRTDCINLLKTMYKNKNIDWTTKKIFLYLISKQG